MEAKLCEYGIGVKLLGWVWEGEVAQSQAKILKSGLHVVRVVSGEC